MSRRAIIIVVSVSVAAILVGLIIVAVNGYPLF
jgi:hypothetical protein